jgi:preprotein translocase subunit SecG
MLKTVFQALFLIDCFALMGLVLVQMSEHSGLGGAFGSGMSSTVFGRDVTKDPKRTLTVGLTTVFMVLPFILTII